MEFVNYKAWGSIFVEASICDLFPVPIRRWEGIVTKKLSSYVFKFQVFIFHKMPVFNLPRINKNSRPKGRKVAFVTKLLKTCFRDSLKYSTFLQLFQHENFCLYKFWLQITGLQANVTSILIGRPVWLRIFFAVSSRKTHFVLKKRDKVTEITSGSQSGENHSDQIGRNFATFISLWKSGAFLDIFKEVQSWIFYRVFCQLEKMEKIHVKPLRGLFQIQFGECWPNENFSK